MPRILSKEHRCSIILKHINGHSTSALADADTGHFTGQMESHEQVQSNVAASITWPLEMFRMGVS